jgi:putative membrane protein
MINSVGILFAANLLGPTRMTLTGRVPAIEVAGPMNAILAGLLLALLNATIKPVLVLFTLPLNILTLGLFTFVINGALLLLVSKMLRGFMINNLWSAILAALLVSAISLVVSIVVRDPDERDH